MKIKYFNPKNCKYTTSDVVKIENDTVFCEQKQGRFTNKYTESLEKLRSFVNAPNPDWHGQEIKPLIKLIGFN